MGNDAMSMFQIDLPESLHKQVQEYAERNGVSLNQYIAVALTEKLARQTHTHDSGTTVSVANATPQAWTDEQNARRCALIDEQIQGTITDAEREELEHLQRRLRQHLDTIAPFDLATARQLHQKLLKKKQENDSQK